MGSKSRNAARAHDLASERFFSLEALRRALPPRSWSETHEHLYQRWRQRMSQAYRKLGRLDARALGEPMSRDAVDTMQRLLGPG